MIKDLTNQRFGKLTVIKLDCKDKRGECKWLCKCDAVIKLLCMVAI